MSQRQEQHNVFAIRTGIHLTFDKRDEILTRLSEEAAKLIRVVELERSGIRDGNGWWSGCEPMEHIVRRINDQYAYLQVTGNASTGEDAP